MEVDRLALEMAPSSEIDDDTDVAHEPGVCVEYLGRESWLALIGTTKLLEVKLWLTMPVMSEAKVWDDIFGVICLGRSRRCQHLRHARACHPLVWLAGAGVPECPGEPRWQLLWAMA